MKLKRLPVFAALVLLWAVLAAGCAGTPETPPGTVPPAPAVTAPAAEPVPTEEAGDGTELLLKRKKREGVESIRYELSYYGTYTLEKGEAGFEDALDILFSLRGELCEKPEGRLSRRTFDLDPRVELVYDGESVYGSTNNGYRWLRLTGEGRPDQALSAIFEQNGSTTPAVGKAAYHYGDRDNGIVDGGILFAETERPVYDLETLTAALQGMKEAYKENGSRDVDERTLISLTVENRSEESCHYYGGSFSLEYLLDGEWHRWGQWSYSYFLLSVELKAGEIKTFQMPMSDFIDPLLPGRYRFALDFGVGDDGDKRRAVAFAEFDLADASAPPVLSVGDAGEILALGSTDADWRRLTLLPGDEGFGELRSLLLSLRGDICRHVAALPLRTVYVYRENSVIRLELASDGERTGLRADGEWHTLAPADLAAVNGIFERYGKENVLFLREPEETAWEDDGSLFLETDRPVYRLSDIRAGWEFIREQALNGRRAEPERLSALGAAAVVRMVNRSGETVCCDYAENGLEILREGTWYRLTMPPEQVGALWPDYSDVDPGQTWPYPPLAAGEENVNCVSLPWFEGLCAGDYRVCIRYRPGAEGEGWDHAAYVRFRIEE